MRNSAAKIFFLLLGIAVCVWGYLVWGFVNDLGECGMNIAPIYGNKIEIIEDLPLEQKIIIPNGKFGLAHLSDSLAPILIKYNKHDSILWAIEFAADTFDIPHAKLSEMRLVKGKYGITLNFFNYSYSEPGTIYLDEYYDFRYMCLSPM